jgi:predicted acylesterase/phospholipase RssA
VASDDAVAAIRATEALPAAVLASSSYAPKEQRRRWLRYPREMVKWIWRSKTKKDTSNLRRPFLEAANVKKDLNGQVQKTANQVLAAIGYNRWIPKSPGQKGLRILCLDGGGSRGMTAVSIINSLVESLGSGAEVSDSFDLIAGTSTGAIISFLLGLRRETSVEAMDRYNALVRKIFVKSALSTPMMLFTTATYDESPYMDILSNILGDESMLDSRADPAVPLVFAVTSKMSSTPTHVALFRNYNYAEGELPDPFTIDPESARRDTGLLLEFENTLLRTGKYTARKAAQAAATKKKSEGSRRSGSRYPGSFRVLQRYALRASTAAPTVFKPVMMGGEMYCDGGIVASNPTAVAIHEAKTLFPGIPIELVVSVGTGGFTEVKSPPRIGWDGIIGQIVNSATDGEQIHHVLEDVLGDAGAMSGSSTQYFRFNPVLGPPDEFPIDVTDPAKLAKLKHIAREYMKTPEQREKVADIDDILNGKQRWRKWMPRRGQ